MNEARIKLAEAMGLTAMQKGSAGHAKGWFIDANDNNVKFNPFTDANDDYAVLEWMRENDKLDSDTFELSYMWNYKIGDYARAACKVLEI